MSYCSTLTLSIFWQSRCTFKQKLWMNSYQNGGVGSESFQDQFPTITIIHYHYHLFITKISCAYDNQSSYILHMLNILMFIHTESFLSCRSCFETRLQPKIISVNSFPTKAVRQAPSSHTLCYTCFKLLYVTWYIN